ncbi:hypothetical protein Tco_0310942 [Tanacetum coccineum]
MSEVFSFWLKSFEIMTGSLLFFSKNAYSRCGGKGSLLRSASRMRMSPSGSWYVALKTGETGSSLIAIKASASSKSRKSLSSKGVSVGDEVETIGSKCGEGLL